MSTSDWVLAGFLLLAVLYGYRQGTINVVARVGAIVLGYLAARSFTELAATAILKALPGLGAQNEGGEQLNAFLSLFVSTDSILNRLLEMIIFVIIFIVVSWLIKRIAYALTSVFGRGLLGGINRAVGAVLALLLGGLLVLICADILFPALDGMGISAAPSQFVGSSRQVLPGLRYLQFFLL